MQDAIARHERYRLADPDNVDLLVALADLYQRAGRHEDALGCLDHVLEIDPSQRAARGRAAVSAMALGRYAEAQAQWRVLLDAAPHDPALQHNLGLALCRLGRWDEARGLLEAALAGGARSADGWSALAHARHHGGDLAAALDAAREWSALGASSAAEGYRALLEMDLGDFDAAYGRAEQVLARDPDDVNAALVAGVASAERQDLARASQLFEGALRREPDNPRGWVGVALAQLYRGEHPAAIAAFERASALSPRNTGTLVALGWAHFTAQDYRAAEAAFRRAIDVDRNFGEAHGGLASALTLQNRRDEAQREVELARRLDPHGFGLVYARSVLLALDGRREAGERLMARAMERSVRPGAPSLIDYVRTFMSQRGSGKS